MKRPLAKKLILATLIISVGLVLLTYLFKFKIGDLRPALLNPKENLVDQIEKQKISGRTELPLKLPSGFEIGVFAKDLGAARDLEFSQDGTLLVSVPEQGKIFAFPDKNNDGAADSKIEVISNLEKPHGLVFHQGKLFIAELTKISRYNFDQTNLKANREKVLFSYPYHGGHSTRSVVVNNDGILYVSIGSSCNVCVEKDERLSSVMISDTEGNNPKVFAKGLRNSVFLALHPKTAELWGTEMGRDMLGDNLPAEEINIIRSGSDYGWPYCFEDKTHDGNFDPRNEHNCSTTVAPTWKMQAHSAPLGLAFVDSTQFADRQGDLLVSFHGSWNRSTPTGYKIVRLKVEDNKIISQEDFITGFIQGSSALGRPVDLIFDKNGSLFISDDKAGAIYKLVEK